jgi:transcription termination factor Rho
MAPPGSVSSETTTDTPSHPKDKEARGTNGAATAVGQADEFGEGIPVTESEESSGEAGSESGKTGSRRRRRRRRRRGGGPEGAAGGNGRKPSNRRSRSRRTKTDNQQSEEVTGTIEGVLELHPKGYGFLRDRAKDYAAQDSDAFVSSSIIERHQLREGVLIRGEVGPGAKGQGPRLKSIETVDGRSIEDYNQIKHFDELTAVTPFRHIRLETGPRPITMRVMDLLTPVGMGQRALIVAPPRTGKTMLLQDIAASVSQNHPELHLIVLLIDERPEEVTEMRRTVNGEVIASSMDRDVESHVRISQLIIERGKRLAESGKDVFILLDSITRAARAFNKWGGNTGRTMSGGLDVKALDIPKKMFGTARQFDEGGSLTICATALIDTGSRMDEVIFQEFKGTGNMELVLNRDLADRRIWPAIDIGKSGTRHEEKLLSPEALEGITLLRRSLVSLSSIEAMEQLTRTLEKYPTNESFLAKIREIL